VEAAADALARAGRPLALEQLAREVLHVESGAIGAAVRVLEPLLAADERLERTDAGHWGLTARARRSHPIETVEFVVFDVETNGGRSGHHRILEIGAERIRGEQVLARYESLVAVPGRISKFVTRLTGITAEMLEDAPPIEQVLDGFREFQSGAVLVAHNLPTDLGYLNREAVWADRALFPGDGLDTMELTNALAPEADNPGLSGALELAGIREPLHHRALADAQVTAKLFSFLVGRARAAGAATLKELHALADRGGPEGPMPRRARELARWASRNLPPCPGVYVFRDRSGRALYVGKTVSLQRRVRSHFTDSNSLMRRRDGMLERTASIDWEATGSELLALLREAELIPELAPAYNVQRRRHAAARFVRVGPPEAAVVHAARSAGEAEGHCVGPFRTAREAQLAGRAVRRIFELPSVRSEEKSAAGWRREAAVAFLTRGRDAALARLEQADVPGAEREHTARQVRRTRTERRPVRGALGGGRALVVDGGREPGAVELGLIESGQLAGWQSLVRPRPGEIRTALESLLAAPQPASEAYSDDQRNVVLHWLHARADGGQIIPLDADRADRRLVDAVWRRVRALMRS
jgi:DNA polymerase-3 subunit epsilon